MIEDPHAETADWLTRQSQPAEEHRVFRVAQLAILLGEVATKKPIDLERLGYYDFFAANPFAVVGQEDSHDRARLHRAAFDERQLAYASTGSRFANRRRRLQHDVALLVAYGLAERRGDGYAQTDRGGEFVNQMTALYVDQYRESVRVVHAHLKNLSPTQLTTAAQKWLRSPSLVLDLYGSGDDTAPGDSEGAHAGGGHGTK